MSSLSSIFSFDTLTGLPRPTRAFLLAIGLCAAVRVGLYAARDRLDHLPAPSIHEQFIKREARLVRGAAVKPKIVLMGDSLTIYGLSEERLARAAGLPAGEVVNLGIEGGRAWDALVLLRRNPEHFKDVRLALLNVGFYQVRQSSVNKRLAHFWRFSTLTEKLGADSRGDRALMLLDAAWPFYSERRDLVTWLAGPAAPSAESLRPAWEPNYMSRLRARKDRLPSGLEASDPAKPGAADAVSALHWQLLGEWVDYWRQRGVAVALIGMPTASKFADCAAPPSPQQIAFEGYVESLAGEGVVHMGWRAGRDAGLSDETDFLDEGHLTPAGAAKLTAAVADRLDHVGWFALARRTDAQAEPTVAARRGQQAGGPVSLGLSRTPP